MINKLSSKMSKVHKLLHFFRQTWKEFALYLSEAKRQQALKLRIKRLCVIALTQPYLSLQRLRKEFSEYPLPKGEAIKRLREKVKRLHLLLPSDERFSYSILIPVYKPDPAFFKMALESALQQTAPHFEVLVGLDGPQLLPIIQVIEELKAHYPDKLKSIELDRATEGGGISASTNALAKRAQGNFLLLLDHDDWIRPDLLYRYEQTLRLIPHPETAVLYCNEYKINEKDWPIWRSGVHKPDRPLFPYVFLNFICHCLLVPKHLWQQVGGLRSECNGSQDFDIALRLDTVGASFYNVPLFLYAWRSHSESTAQNPLQKGYALDAGMKALTDYVQQKGLNWTIEHGQALLTYRAIPHLSYVPQIHAILASQNSRENVLSTVLNLKQQKGVEVKITVVHPSDMSVSETEDLRALGVEVLASPESFNLSHCYNLAVRQTKIGSSCSFILFINPSVELKADALLEMSRWADQPDIGLVGCRLHYPKEIPAVAGIQIESSCEKKGPTEKFSFFEATGLTAIQRIVETVPTTCALIKRETFLDVKGFDEVWYPSVHQVNLAAKLKAKGFLCFYTPYAEGFVREEEPSDDIHDYEMSSWLAKHYESHQLSKGQL